MGATNWAELETRRDTITAQLAAMLSTSVGGKPNTTGQGQQLDHVAYKKGLYDELRDIRELLATRPFFIETEVG